MNFLQQHKSIDEYDQFCNSEMTNGSFDSVCQEHDNDAQRYQDKCIVEILFRKFGASLTLQERGWMQKKLLELLSILLEVELRRNE